MRQKNTPITGTSRKKRGSSAGFSGGGPKTALPRAGTMARTKSARGIATGQKRRPSASGVSSEAGMGSGASATRHLLVGRRLGRDLALARGGLALPGWRLGRSLALPLRLPAPACALILAPDGRLERRLEQQHDVHDNARDDARTVGQALDGALGHQPQALRQELLGGHADQVEGRRRDDGPAHLVAVLPLGHHVGEAAQDDQAQHVQKRVHQPSPPEVEDAAPLTWRRSASQRSTTAPAVVNSRVRSRCRSLPAVRARPT